MVHQNNQFIVELVRTTNKEPFQERVGRDGRVYIEVEPEAEFFIRVENHHPSAGKVLVKYEVDGRALRYCQPLRAGAEGVGGIRSVHDGKKTKKAFRFEKASSMNKSYDDYAATTSGVPWMGCIKARFYEAVNTGGYRVLEDHEVNQQWGDGEAGFFVADQERKVLKTSQGSTVLDSKHVLPGRKIKDYSRGNKLGSVTMYYGTTVGLISLGVIPRPSPLDLQQMVLSHVKA